MNNTRKELMILIAVFGGIVTLTIAIASFFRGTPYREIREEDCKATCLKKGSTRAILTPRHTNQPTKSNAETIDYECSCER